MTRLSDWGRPQGGPSGAFSCVWLGLCVTVGHAIVCDMGSRIKFFDVTLLLGFVMGVVTGAIWGPRLSPFGVASLAAGWVLLYLAMIPIRWGVAQLLDPSEGPS